MKTIDARKYSAVEAAHGSQAAIEAFQADLGSTGELKLVQAVLPSFVKARWQWCAYITDIYVFCERDAFPLGGVHETPQGAIAELLQQLLNPSSAIPEVLGYDPSKAVLHVSETAKKRPDYMPVPNSP